MVGIYTADCKIKITIADNILLYYSFIKKSAKLYENKFTDV